MSLPNPFQPVGPTFAANATTTSGTIQMNWSVPTAYFNITNIGSNPVFYRLSINTITSAVIPTPGTNSSGQMINAGDSQTILIPAADINGSGLFVTQANIAVITPAG